MPPAQRRVAVIGCSEGGYVIALALANTHDVIAGFDADPIAIAAARHAAALHRVSDRVTFEAAAPGRLLGSGGGHWRRDRSPASGSRRSGTRHRHGGSLSGSRRNGFYSGCPNAYERRRGLGTRLRVASGTGRELSTSFSIIGASAASEARTSRLKRFARTRRTFGITPLPAIRNGRSLRRRGGLQGFVLCFTASRS